MYRMRVNTIHSTFKRWHNSSYVIKSSLRSALICENFIALSHYASLSTLDINNANIKCCFDGTFFGVAGGC